MSRNPSLLQKSFKIKKILKRNSLNKNKIANLKLTISYYINVLFFVRFSGFLANLSFKKGKNNHKEYTQRWVRNSIIFFNGTDGPPGFTFFILHYNMWRLSPMSYKLIFASC